MLENQPERPRIWIVDDSPTEALITERSLGTDYEFEKFSDGSIVVERLSETSELPDVLLLDWVMPGMAGDEVCRYLRSNARTQTLPIILVTASRVETGDVVAGLASGANDYVARPFAPEELRARVDAVIRSAQLREAATRERRRLDTVNRLGHALLAAGASVEDILDQLTATLTMSMCDGCSIILLPGSRPPAMVTRHRAEPSGSQLAAISSLADPALHAFASSAHARAALPPAYWPYVDRFGLRGLAILPFPSLEPLEGVVTVTRDGGSDPFEPEDIATIGTCIEYAALAVKTALRFDAERTARDQLHAVLEHLPIGIIATDRTGAINLVNAWSVDLVPGIASATQLAEALALVAWTTPAGASVDHVELLRDHALHANETTRRELAMLRPDGVRLAVLVSTVPLRDGQGLVNGSITAIEDVTAERLIDIERQNVGRYQQQMLGIVGHDLRNPLSAMAVGMAMLAELGTSVPKIGPVVTRLTSSVQRMTRIVEQLLDVTHARLGQGIPMSPTQAKLVPVVRAAIEELSLAYPETRFELLADGADVSGFWDGDRLGQVLSNLMSNAANYGRPRTPVQIQLASSGDDATFTVTNTNRDGPIPPELVESLFDPYKRGADHRKHQRGLGLGLYIVDQIVRAHGGSIEVISGDETTSFRVTLPLHH